MKNATPYSPLCLAQLGGWLVVVAAIQWQCKLTEI